MTFDSMQLYELAKQMNHDLTILEENYEIKKQQGTFIEVEEIKPIIIAPTEQPKRRGKRKIN